MKELFLTLCTVFTQFEKTYLAFLNILAKYDFLEKMTLGPCRIGSLEEHRQGIIPIGIPKGIPIGHTGYKSWMIGDKLSSLNCITTIMKGQLCTPFANSIV